MTSPGSAVTFTIEQPRSVNHFNSSCEKPNQSDGPQVFRPKTSGLALKNSGISLLDPFITKRPPSSGPLGAKFKIPCTHCSPVLFGFWSICGHGSVGVNGVPVGSVKFIPSKETRSLSVSQTLANASITPGSLFDSKNVWVRQSATVSTNGFLLTFSLPT